jgi:L-fucose mutarotase/ribose pyranase (RbsD/FucU family)
MGELMALVTYTAILRLEPGTAEPLPRSHVTGVLSAVNMQRQDGAWTEIGPLVEGADFVLVPQPGSTPVVYDAVQRPAELPAVWARLVLEYDDRSETEAAEAAAVEQDHSRFRQDFAQALQLLNSGIPDMQTIESATFANNAQRDAAIKRTARGVREGYLILRRMLRLEARRLGGVDVPPEA